VVDYLNKTAFTTVRSAMGNNESNPIRNMDKRTARREYRGVFMKTISSYRKRRKDEPLGTTELSLLTRDINWANESDQNIRVCVRKRPIFKHEIEDFEFDVVSAIEGRIAVIHDGRMHTDMRRHFMNHHQFTFDKVFDERTNNEEVYKAAVAPLTRYAAVDGGYCTCLVYGQTGSGKTFTMSSVYIQAADDLFAQLDTVSNRFDTPPIVSVSFIELAGDNCFDLLNGFNPAQLLSGVDGSVHAFPVVEPEVSSAEELAAMIAHGFGVRSTGEKNLRDAFLFYRRNSTLKEIVYY
jgi:kinesin family member 2/24